MRYITTLLIALLCFGAIDAMAQVHMSGRVTNDNEEPLIGALVKLADTDIRVLSRSDGTFELDIPQQHVENGVVVASFFGYPSDSSRVMAYHDFVLITKHLEEINTITYVSTQKRMQSNVEVPISIAALGETKLEKLKICDPQELSLYTPGYHNQTQSCMYSVNVIRGVASDGSRYYSFFQPRISVFLDGVSITHMGTAGIELFDMQRAEVVKGPQGTLFGKGAEFGAVSYVTNKPTDGFEANLQMSIGSYLQNMVQGMVNTPINSNTQNRFSFYRNYRNGYNENAVDGSKLSGKGAFSLRDIIRHKPNENLTLTLSLDYERNREPGVSAKGNTNLGPNYSTSPYDPAYIDVTDLAAERDMGVFNYMVDHKLSSNLSYSSITALRAYKLYEHYDLDGCVLPITESEDMQNGVQFSQEVRVNWDNNDRLTAFAGLSYMYDRNKHKTIMSSNLQKSFKYLVDASLQNLIYNIPTQLAMGIQDGLGQVMSGYNKYLSESEVAKLEPLIDDIKVTVGNDIRTKLTAKYTEMKNSQIWTSTPDVYGTSYAIASEVITEKLKEALMSDASTEYLADYIVPENVVSALGLEKILAVLKYYSSLELPAEYQENETDMNIYHEADVFADATYRFTDKLYFTMGLRGTFERQKTSYYSTSNVAPLVGYFVYHSTDGVTHWLHDTEISWVGRAVANYMVTPTNNIYLSFSKGRRPGSIYYNFDYKNAVKLRPEVSLNYELGIKGSLLKNHVVYSVAGYFYNWLNFQSQVAKEGENGVRTYVHSDDGKAYAGGMELSLDLYLDRVNLFADYSFINAKFAKRDCKGNEQNLAGNTFRMTPKHTLDLGMDCTVPIQNKFGLYVRPSVSWVSEMFFSNENTSTLWQDGYGLCNFSIGVNFSVKRVTFDVGIYGKNIFNQKYLLDAGGPGLVMGCPTFIMAPPSMFGIGLKLGYK